MQFSAVRHARAPLIQFLGKRSVPKNVDHTPRVHPASGMSELPTTFAQYRQAAQTYGPISNSPSSSGATAASGHEGAVYESVLDLPKRFHNPAFSELELDTINSGGADYVF